MERMRPSERAKMRKKEKRLAKNRERNTYTHSGANTSHNIITT